VIKQQVNRSAGISGSTGRVSPPQRAANRIQSLYDAVTRVFGFLTRNSMLSCSCFPINRLRLTTIFPASLQPETNRHVTPSQLFRSYSGVGKYEIPIKQTNFPARGWLQSSMTVIVENVCSSLALRWKRCGRSDWRHLRLKGVGVGPTRGSGGKYGGLVGIWQFLREGAHFYSSGFR